MDYTVSWSPEALSDVDDIANHIARDSTFYAQSVVTKIVESARKIADFPFAARIDWNSVTNTSGSASFTVTDSCIESTRTKCSSSPSSTANACSKPPTIE